MTKEAINNIKQLNLYIPIYNKMYVKLSKKDSLYNFELRDHFVEKGNEMAFEILCKCNGKNSIKEIVDKILIEYEVEYERLAKDVIMILHEAWKKAIVIWDKENPFAQVYYKEVEKKGYVYKRMFAKEFVENSKNLYKNIVINDLIKREIWYQEKRLESVEKIGLEYYFGLIENSEVKCLLAMIPEVILLENNLKTISIKINYLFVDSISEYEFHDFLRWIVWFLFNVEEINIDLKSCFFQMEVATSIETDSLMTKMGFEKVSVLGSRSSHFERILK